MSKFIVVGSTRITDKENQCRICRYSDVPESKGWVHDLSYRPIPFDLMFLQVSSSSLPKSGWWTGKKWAGLKIRKEDTIVKWKRNMVITND